MLKIFINSELSIGDVFEVDGEDHHHLKVVRAKVADVFLIGDKNFSEFKAEVTNVNKKKYILKVMEKITAFRKPSRYLTLYVSLPKKKKFEDLIFKCSQVGVSKFVPMISGRTEKVIKDSSKIYQRWNKKARYGAELSMRESIPVIERIMSFNDALNDFVEGGYSSGIFLWEEEEGNYISRGDFAKSAKNAKKVAVFIGPEGGFSAGEVELAKSSGLKVRSIGKLIMDVETACIAVSSILLCMYMKV